MSTWRGKITVASDTYGWGESKRTRPALDVTYELTIDLAKLVQHLGEKAARSKGRRTKALAGLVKVKATKVVERQSPP